MVSLFSNFCDLPWWLYWLLPFLLGIILGWLIWSKYKRMVFHLKQDKEKLHINITDLKDELNDSRSKQSELVGDIALLKGRIREIERAREEAIPNETLSNLEKLLKEERSIKAELQGKIALLKGTIAELEAEAEKSGNQSLSESSVEAGGDHAVNAQEQIARLEKELKESKRKRSELEGEKALLWGKIEEIQYKETVMKKIISEEPQSMGGAKQPTGGKEADDLKMIEGIGPKIEELLRTNGIHSFLDLSNESVTNLESILEKGGSSFRLAKPATWAKQAKMAAEGRFEELEAYQIILKGGA